MKNKKLKATLSITGYFLLLLAICFVGALVFHSYYYESVYVHGNSMNPTLNGGENEGEEADFGIVDTHKSAINHIKRFDIISTYYSEDYSFSGQLLSIASKKIKRVIGMPGDTFIIKDGLLSVKEGNEFVSVPYKFKVSAITTEKDTADPLTLSDDEYWVLGDNRTNSRDSAYVGKIQKKYISGVLVAIEGKAKLKVKGYRCNTCGKIFKTQSKPCTNCGDTTFTTQYKLVNKKYSWPRFF